MRKVIAAINMTLDGFCDHTAVDPDEEIHQHYADLLDHAGVALYGRITYQLMEYWRGILKEPTGEKETDDFAKSIDRLPKIVFSRTLKEVDWPTASLAEQDLSTVITSLKGEAGNDILVCSPGLIVQCTRLGLIDEYQLCIHPVIAGGGLPLFKEVNTRVVLELTGQRKFRSGAVILYYQPENARASG